MQSYKRKLYNIQPKTVFVGKTIKYLPTCHSTNDYCQKLLINGELPDGIAVITDYQISGKGQRGNSWESDAGKNILMSVFIKPKLLNAQDQFQLNIAVSLGIYNAIQKVIIRHGLKIKWPNDIYFKDKKLGGILIENTILGNQINSSIIGIGLNINQLDFINQNAISLKSILEITYDLDRGEIVNAVFEEIESKLYDFNNQFFGKLNEEYLESLYRNNSWHHFRKNGNIFEGKIIGIDNNGRLKVKTQFDTVYYDFKEIEFVI